jgi:cytochrome P450
MVTDANAAPPFTRTCPYAPRAEHIRLRDEAGISKVVLPTGEAAWVVARHADIRAVLGDPRFSSQPSRPGYPFLSREEHLVLGQVRAALVAEDPPRHTVTRRGVAGEFTVKRVAALRPRIQQIVEEQIGVMLAAGPRQADLVQALSLPIPTLTICELLGVPYADHDFFQKRTALPADRNASPEDVRQGFDELAAYIDGLVTAKEKAAAPPDDLIGRQIRRQRDEGAVDHRLLVDLVAELLFAGHDTTANMISLSVLILLEKPGALAVLRNDPAKIPAAVEELLRYFTIAEFIPRRTATEDVEIGGVLIRAGEGVIPLSNTANRDPDVFADPDEFDIERTDNHHVAFGFGRHQCIGQNLARLELQIVVGTLFQRVPGLRLARPSDELPFKDGMLLYGPYEMPVEW